MEFQIHCKVEKKDITDKEILEVAETYEEKGYKTIYFNGVYILDPNKDPKRMN